MPPFQDAIRFCTTPRVKEHATAFPFTLGSAVPPLRGSGKVVNRYLFNCYRRLVEHLGLAPFSNLLIEVSYDLISTRHQCFDFLLFEMRLGLELDFSLI